MYGDLPMLAIDLGSDGRVIDCSEHLLRQLRLSRQALMGTSVAALFDEAGRKVILDCLNAAARMTMPIYEPLVFVRSGDASIPTMARIAGVQRASGIVLRVLAAEPQVTGDLLVSLYARMELMEGFMETSSEAMWCIEFTEPVDLNRNDSEIVRQVFNNERRWILCNRAMAILYSVPTGIDIHDIPVSLIFPQSPVNEHFVRQLIEHGFKIDRSPAVDLRYDGTVIYVENSVRGQIDGMYLHRMWGTVRDITDFKRQQQLLSQSESRFRDVLTALPDALILVTQHRIILAVNPAFERLVGLTADAILERDFSSFLLFSPEDDVQRRWHNGSSHRWACDAVHVDGALVECEVRMAPLETQANRFVISVRPSSPPPVHQSRAGIPPEWRRR